jgi:hypothetical protein
MTAITRHLVTVLIVVGILIMWYAAGSYRHFEWQHVTTTQGAVFAIPSWRK